MHDDEHTREPDDVEDEIEETLPTTFAEGFGLKKSQFELDFVDVPLNEDLPLFVDPFALSQRKDDWSINAHRTLAVFFQQVIDLIRNGSEEEARSLLSHLAEPNETRLGFSVGRAQGAGVGPRQASELFEALQGSSAVKTGFLTALEECELMVDGMGRDKISDLTTNVIRGDLVEYTQGQCALWNIPTREVPLPPTFDVDEMRWTSGYHRLPIHEGKPVLLVPKAIARYASNYDHQKYYRKVVLEYLQAEVLDGSTSLARSLRHLVREYKRRAVHKKALKEHFPLTKKFLYQFSEANPTALKGYREMLKERELNPKQFESANEDERDELEERERELANALAMALPEIPTGRDHATAFHHLMIGAVEFLFYPHLLNPRKEQEIHDGRKRIDITMGNNASSGIFWRISNAMRIPCGYVAIECKNYSREVENPELDQLAGRFSMNRGKLGLLMCRSFDDRPWFVKRCQDTFKDDRGLIIPFDDERVLTLLRLVEDGQRAQLDKELSDWVQEVVMG